MRRFIALVLLLLAVILVGCSLYIDITPHLRDGIDVDVARHQHRYGGEPTRTVAETGVQTVPLTVTVTVETIVTEAVPAPFALLNVHAANVVSTTLPWQQAHMVPLSRTVQLCDPTDLSTFGNTIAEMAVATPLFALVTTAGVTTTNEYGLPSYDPDQSRTLYYRDPGLSAATPCTEDAPWLWQEMQYIPSTTGSGTGILHDMTLAVQQTCPMEPKLSASEFVSVTASTNEWLDVVVLQLPNGNIRVIRLIHHPRQDLCGSPGGGGSAKAALCSRVSCEGLYGQVVCKVVGC